MQVFKTALKVILRHPTFLITYIIVLSCFGLFLVSALVGTDSTEEYEASRPTVAIIDRDGGAVTQGLAEEFARHAEIVEIDDNRQVLQDATAQGLADYIIIAEPGFSDDFLEALSEGKDAPALETVVSYISIYGTMMDQITNQYLSLFSTVSTVNSQLTTSELIAKTSQAMESSAQVKVESMGDSKQMSEGFLGFLRFSSYPLTVGIIVCVTMLMSAFNRGEIRRRDLASPIKLSSFNSQTALACLMIALFAWAWIGFLSLAAFSGSFEGVPLINIALIMLVVLVFVTVPLALGYLFAQLGLKENAANAAGNIIAMALSFLGGAWIDIKLLGSEVVSVAHFTPSYWYTDAITQIATLSTTPTQAVLGTVFGNLGIILLFAAAIFVVALVIGRTRVQSADAGGNTAAARSRM